jgi:hypothetical protein
MSTQSPADLRPAQLDALLHDLQKRAFDIYEDAALRAEANPARAEMAYAQAEAEAAPLIARARALNEERVRRLRLRARRWHTAAITVALAGTAAVAVWLGFRG